MDFRGLMIFWTRLSLIVETIPRHNEFKAASYLLERQEFTKVTMVTLVTWITLVGTHCPRHSVHRGLLKVVAVGGWCAL